MLRYGIKKRSRLPSQLQPINQNLNYEKSYIFTANISIILKLPYAPTLSFALALDLSHHFKQYLPL